MTKKRLVKVLSVTTSDRASVEGRVKFALRLIQIFLRQFCISFDCGGAKTFSLDPNDQVATSDPLCLLHRDFNVEKCDFQWELLGHPLWSITAKNQDCHLDSKSLWTALARHLVKTRGNEKYVKYLVVGEAPFPRKEDKRSCTHESTHESTHKSTQFPHESTHEPVVAERNGSLALALFCDLDSWPKCLDDLRLLVKSKSGLSPNAYGHCLGTILHELCHTFDLLHTESGIMNRDFVDIINVLSRVLLAEGGKEIHVDAFGKSVFSSAGMRMLSHHAWLNNNDDEEDDNDNDDDDDDNHVHELPEIVVDRHLVSIRNPLSGILIQFVQICIDDRVVKDVEVNCAEFSLRRDDIKDLELQGHDVLGLMVMDSVGNVHKRSVNVYDVYLNNA